MARKKRIRKPKSAPSSPGPEQAPEPGFKEIVLDPAAFQLGAVVSDKVRLNDIILVGLALQRLDEIGDGRLRINFTSKSNAYGTNANGNQLVVRPTLSISAHRRSGDKVEKEELIFIEATFVILYICENVDEIAAENVEAFANSNAIFNVWPFWRELVMSVSTRMRITPIVVPLLRI